MSKQKYSSLLKTSKVNGWSITIFSGLILLSSLISGNWVGILISALIVLTGSAELFGRKLLMQDDPSAAIIMPWSQLTLLIIIWLYCIVRLISFDPNEAMALLNPASLGSLRVILPNEKDMVAMIGKIYKTTYIAVMIVTAVYQGGLGVYYFRGTRYLLGKQNSPDRNTHSGTE